MTDITPELELHSEINRDMKIPRIIGEYRIEKKILDTLNSVVVEAVKQKTQEKFAIKCISTKRFTPELESIYKEVNNPHIIKFLEFIPVPEKDPRFTAIVMPLASCDALDYINVKHDHPYNHTDDHMKESTAREIMKSIFEAVNYLHSIHVCHCDIKPEHILMMTITSENPTVCLTGIDCAIRHETDTISEPPRGTEFYAAPELLQQKSPICFKSSAKFSNKVDSWSLGVVLYTILSGEHPFITSSDLDLPKLLHGEFNLESAIFQNVSVKAKDLIRKLICVDPNNRISVKEALQHPWFQ